jgi:hypothetical protein
MQFSRRFSLRTLLLAVSILGVSLAVWHAYGEPQLRRLRLINQQGFQFTFEQSFIHTDGRRYHVFVFDSVFKSWPGHNPYKIVVTTEDYCLRTSAVFGGEEFLEAVATSSERNKSILRCTCLHRPMRGGVGTYRYLISPTQISRCGDVIWDDPDYWDRFAESLEHHADQEAASDDK